MRGLASGALTRVRVLAREDLRQTLRDRSSIFWIFIAPFLWVFFFGFVSQGSDPSDTRISLAVVQEDDSPPAHGFVGQLRAENFAVTVFESATEVPGGKNAPARVITIPEGFGEAIAQRRPVTLKLRAGSRANQEATFAAEVALHRATIRLLAGEAFGGLDPAEDAVTVSSTWGRGREMPSGYYQTIPGNLVMFVLISSMAYGAGLLATERRMGLLRRLASSRVTRGEIIVGKLAGRVGIALVQTAVFVFIGLIIFPIDWGDTPAGLALLLASWVLVAASIGMLAGATFSTPDAASGVGVVLTLLMSAIGGCWWPAEIMPGWLRTAALIFPTTWAMAGLNEIISWDGRFADVIPHIGVLLVFAVASSAVAARLLKVTES